MTARRETDLPADRFAALADLVHRESELLEQLVFGLRCIKMLVDARELRSLALVVDDLDSASSDLGAIELERAVLAADIAQACRLQGGAGLSELAERAPQHLAGSLYRRREQMMGLMGELASVAAAATETANERLAEVTIALDAIHVDRSASTGR